LTDKCTFDQFVAENPNAMIQTVKLEIGQNSGDNWSGFAGYVDDVTMAFGTGASYDLGG
jgi:hypothetical protein